MKINSIIFHTNRLAEIKDFYEKKLFLKIGAYEQNGQVVPDCSENYVNYDIANILLCFEVDKERSDIGTVVLKIENFVTFKKHLEQQGIKVIGGNDIYFKVKDPEGRSLIFEPINFCVETGKNRV